MCVLRVFVVNKFIQDTKRRNRTASRLKVAQHVGQEEGTADKADKS